MLVSIEFFYKVKCKYIITAIPQFDFRVVVGICQDEFCRQCCGRIWFYGKIFKNFTRFFSDQHSRNTNTSASAIISHNYVCDILLTVINHNDKWGSCSLCITYFCYKWAASSVHKDNLCGESILFELKFRLRFFRLWWKTFKNLVGFFIAEWACFEGHLLTTIHVVLVEVDLTNLFDTIMKLNWGYLQGIVRMEYGRSWRSLHRSFFLRMGTYLKELRDHIQQV